MNSRCRIARLTAVFALCMTAMAAAAIEPCFKNHYILNEPCPDWFPAQAGLTDLDVRVLAVDPVKRTTIYAGGPSGVFKSIDAGAAWSLTGLDQVARNAADTAAALGYFREGWDAVGEGFKADSVVAHLAVDPVNPSVLYAGTRIATGKGCTFMQTRLFKSTDGGAIWADVGSSNGGCSHIDSLVLAPGDRATLYVANIDAMEDTFSPLMKSTDGMATWTYPSYPYVSYVVLKVLAVDPIDTRTVYGGTFDFNAAYTKLPRGVLKSSDGGVTWKATGASWNAVNEGLDSFIGTSSTVSALVVDADDSNTVYVAMGRGGILRTLDGGATWSAFDVGLPPSSVQALALVAGYPNSTLYAGTSSGMFKREFRTRAR